jgi:HD-like signal output (HDOD) protein/ActR/RegA family two-component response regulator
MSQARRPRVLFVDDEPLLLDGLRRAMHGQRARFDMTFVLSGTDALRHLAGQPTDIVLSDMRMPGMDGAAVLGEVARAYPHVIRIILSGQSDADAARRAVHVAHQFLAKPVAARALAELIVRLGDLCLRLDDLAVRRLATATSVLSAVPALYDDVTRLCADDSTSAAQFAAVIERDPAMTAKLLHLAGSSFFGRPLRATGIAGVVSYLGVDTLRTIVRDGELAATVRDDPIEVSEVATRQLHSLLVARIARRIVPDRASADDAFAAGLLHDIGKRFAVDDAGDSASAGAYLLGIWGLPAVVVEAVAGQRDTERGSLLAAVTRTANALAHECMGNNGSFGQSTLTADSIESIGMGESLAFYRAIAAEESVAVGSTAS